MNWAREVAAFWQANPPASFSFPTEALAFCAFLERRALRSFYLAEVLAYASAPPSSSSAPGSVRRRRRACASATTRCGCSARSRPCLLLGGKDGDAPLRWTLVDAVTPSSRYDHAHAADTDSGAKGITT